MFDARYQRRLTGGARYIFAAIWVTALVLSQISCRSKDGEPGGAEVQQRNANAAREIGLSPPQPPPPQPTPERREDVTALRLVRVIHAWCDYKETPYLETGLKLSSAWRSKYPTDPLYYPYGVDRLIRRLKREPAFKEKKQVKGLDTGYFHPDTGIKTAGELYDFIEFNREFSARQ